jgi:uncharacterized protein
MSEAFRTDLLDEAIAQRRQRNEQSRQAILAALMDWLTVHAAEFGIERAYIFGSLSRPGRFTERSDVDLAIESMRADRFFEAISTLSEALGRDVDLVELEKCHFGDRIREQGILWTNATLPS